MIPLTKYFFEKSRASVRTHEYFTNAEKKLSLFFFFWKPVVHIALSFEVYDWAILGNIKKLWIIGSIVGRQSVLIILFCFLFLYFIKCLYVFSWQTTMKRSLFWVIFGNVMRSLNSAGELKFEKNWKLCNCYYTYVVLMTHIQFRKIFKHWIHKNLFSRRQTNSLNVSCEL